MVTLAFSNQAPRISAAAAQTFLFATTDGPVYCIAKTMDAAFESLELILENASQKFLSVTTKDGIYD